MSTFKSMSALQALKAIEEMVEFTRHSLDNTLQAGTRAASTSYHHAMASTEEQMDAANATTTDIAGLQQGTLKAAMQSSTILFDGMQELTREWISAAHQAVEGGVAHTKATRGAKSINQLMRMNQSFAQNNVEKAVSESTRLAEQSMKLAEDASRPLSLHISDTVVPKVNEHLMAAIQALVKPVKP